MKKLLIFVLVILLLLISATISFAAQAVGDLFVLDLYDSYSINAQRYLLDAPTRQNAVPAYLMDGFVDWQNANDYYVDADEIETRYNYFYPNAYLLKSAFPYYNCHSYAWHSQNYSNNYFWIDFPDGYIGNGYVEVTGNIKKGDIICYYDNNGTPNNYSDDENIHSGIVVGVVSGATSNGQCGNSNTVTVQSKWGAWGLYQHNGYECPYTNYRTIEELSANYVKYYRRTDHTHYHTSYSQLSSSDSLYADFHKSSCSCGQIIYEAHQIGNTPNAMNPSEEFPPNYIVPLCCIYCGYEPTSLTY